MRTLAHHSHSGATGQNVPGHAGVAQDQNGGNVSIQETQ